MTRQPAPPELIETLRRINAGRLAHREPDAAAAAAAHLAHERTIDQRFGASRRLATYGSLMPGQENTHLLDGVRGTWTEGTVRGQLHDRGWGSGRGFPGLVWNPEGREVRVHILTSNALPARWTALDEFEGAEYLRILIPVETPDGMLLVANLYALRG